MITEQDLKDFVRGHYYTDIDEDGEEFLWQPFENEDEATINFYMENDVLSLKRFLEERGVEIK